MYWPTHLQYLIRELQSSKGVHKEKAVQAIQTALCFTENAFATLSVEIRQSILQLNQQLVQMAEEEFNSGKLIGDDYGKTCQGEDVCNLLTIEIILSLYSIGQPTHT